TNRIAFDAECIAFKDQRREPRQVPATCANVDDPSRSTPHVIECCEQSLQLLAFPLRDGPERRGREFAWSDSQAAERCQRPNLLRELDQIARCTFQCIQVSGKSVGFAGNELLVGNGEQEVRPAASLAPRW